MPSTPEQLAAKHELKRLTKEVGRLAYKLTPPAEWARGRNLSEVKHERFYHLEHVSLSIPAIKTDGVVTLSFWRAEVRGKVYGRHLWKPGYTAAKPESVTEMTEVLNAEIARLRSALGMPSA